MQTKLAPFISDTSAGREAQEILGRCVHCGFCTATCPTYQLLGNELDGPRGRIYLIKSMLEGTACSKSTLLHLDRCLTCRSCETTCPSGVEYGRLLEIGRQVAEKTVPRPISRRLGRRLLAWFLTSGLFPVLLGLGRSVRRLCPENVARYIPVRYAVGEKPSAIRSRQMIVLEGCVQPALSPNINAAAARVLDRLGISLIRASEAGCCGALALHLSIEDRARQAMRRNIDAWWPLLEAGAECIVMTASGCGVTVKEYGQVLADDSQYAEKAERVSSLTWDLSEILLREPMTASLAGRGVSVAVQTPCSLQHGQGINGSIEEILSRVGFQQSTVENPHLCCGSAGSYSILQSSIAKRLRQEKLTALQAGGPNVIATANVGCQVHLAAKSRVPVRHWIELVDSAMQLND